MLGLKSLLSHLFCGLSRLLTLPMSQFPHLKHDNERAYPTVFLRASDGATIHEKPLVPRSTQRKYSSNTSITIIRGGPKGGGNIWVRSVCPKSPHFSPGLSEVSQGGVCSSQPIGSPPGLRPRQQDFSLLQAKTQPPHPP